MQESELAFIGQKLLRFKSTYQIYLEETLFADVVKEISFSNSNLRSMFTARTTSSFWQLLWSLIWFVTVIDK